MGSITQSKQQSGPSRAWWKEASVYQIYPASFNDSNNDGLGDIKGIIEKVDYLKDLGVDVVWLCPIYKSPQCDMGYDIADYRDIHEPYGTLADVDELIEALHGRGMKFVMDLVVNHTSDQHAWFQESRKDKTNPKQDWYIWKAPKMVDGKRTPPNNWASCFGGPAWTYVEARDEYYLNLFCPEQPDLNWENPDVVTEVHDIMHFWLKKGVDGFRMDVINMISKTPGLPDAPVVFPGRDCQPGSMHHSYGPRLHEWLKGLRSVLDQYDAFAVGEMPCVKKEEQVAATVAADRKELNMIFQFDIVDMDIGTNGKFSPQAWDANSLKTIINKWQTLMYKVDGWNALFIENHDQARTVSRFTPHKPENWKVAAKMLATFIGMQAGTLYVYQGQELGMTNLPESWPIDEYKDIETINQHRLQVERVQNDKAKMDVYMTEVHKKARDHARSPVQWTNEAPNAGFTAADNKPWMRVNENFDQVNAQQQLQDEDSVHAYWRNLLKTRKKYADTLVYGDFELVHDGHPSIISYKRTRSDGGASAWVALNFTEQEQAWKAPAELLDAATKAEQLLSNYAQPISVDCEKLVLRPFEARVLYTA
jgi:glycosidase